MERLTERNEKGGACSSKDFTDIVNSLANYEDLEGQCIEENQCDLRMLLLKWKEFFDDIAELYDYRKAEEQGLLLRLPCKVGDTIYHIEDGYIYEFKARSIDIRMENGEYIFCIASMDYKAEDFGKIVFLTEKDAETALAKKSKEDATETRCPKCGSTKTLGDGYCYVCGTARN